MLFFTGRYYLCRQYSSYTQWSSGDASSTCLSWIWVCKTSWYVVLSMLHSMFGCNFMQRKFKYFIGYISSDRSFYTLNISREGLLVTLDLNEVKFEVMGCRWLNLTTWAKTRVVVEYSQWQFVYFFSQFQVHTLPAFQDWNLHHMQPDQEPFLTMDWKLPSLVSLT